MLDLSLFGRPVFSASVISALFNYVALNTVLFLIPFYLIQGRGLNSAQAGLLLSAQPLVMAIAAPLSGTLSDKIGSRLPATMGMLILAGGLFLLSRLHGDSSLSLVSGGLAVCGLGTGMFVSPNNSALMGSAPRNRQGIAAGMLATARNVGQVLGIGMSGAVLNSYYNGNDVSGLYLAVPVGFFVAAVISLLAAAVSATRGKA